MTITVLIEINPDQKERRGCWWKGGKIMAIKKKTNLITLTDARQK